MAQSYAKARYFLEHFSWAESAAVQVGIFPSYPHLNFCAEKIATKKWKLLLGAQDCSTEQEGAFTGEVSAEMLRECDVKSVLIGHSERRLRGGETHESLTKKLKRVASAGLLPVYCIGETQAQREAGKVFDVLRDQLGALENFKSEFLIAYEPVWAIGTGKTAMLDDIREAHTFIHKGLSGKFSGFLGVLYGGSVKAENSREILNVSGVQGLLVGGASLDPIQFKKIVESAPTR